MQNSPFSQQALTSGHVDWDYFANLNEYFTSLKPVTFY
jgi:hypothetical protein